MNVGGDENAREVQHGDDLVLLVAEMLINEVRTAKGGSETKTPFLFCSSIYLFSLKLTSSILPLLSYLFYLTSSIVPLLSALTLFASPLYCRISLN